MFKNFILSNFMHTIIKIMNVKMIINIRQRWLQWMLHGAL